MLVVIEGGDYTGKTSLLSSLKEIFPEAITYAFPSRAPDSYGSIARTMLNNTETFDYGLYRQLCILDMYDIHKKLIAPALKEGKLVILDRFYLSSFAYSHINNSVPKIGSSLLKKWLLDVVGLPVPDLTIVLTAHPSVIESRQKKRGAADAIEQSTKSSAITEAYLLAKELFCTKENSMLIDTSYRSTNEIADQLLLRITTSQLANS